MATFIERANAESADRMNEFCKNSTRDVTVGMVGRDYFLGVVEVVMVNDDAVSLRTADGNISRQVLKYWLGLGS